jgi:hypothetical protein
VGWCVDLPAGAARLHRAIRIYSKIALIAFGLLAPDLALAQAQRPTATDVFQLRNECAKLGKEF